MKKFLAFFITVVLIVSTCTVLTIVPAQAEQPSAKLYDQMYQAADFVRVYYLDKNYLESDIVWILDESNSPYVGYDYYEDPDLISFNSARYAVAPVNVMKEYYNNFLAAPKGFFENVILNDYKDTEPCVAAKKDGSKLEFSLGYDADKGTFGVMDHAYGGGSWQEYEGFIDNNDGTYTFYFADYDYVYDEVKDEDSYVMLGTGYAVTLKPESDGIALISNGNVSTLPSKYSGFYIDSPYEPTYDQYQNMLKTVDFVCDSYAKLTGEDYYAEIFGTCVKKFPNKYTPGSANEEWYSGVLRVTEADITAAAKQVWPYIADNTIRSLFIDRLLEQCAIYKNASNVYELPGPGGRSGSYIKNADHGKLRGYVDNYDGTYSFYYSVNPWVYDDLSQEEFDTLMDLFTAAYIERGEETVEYNGKVYHCLDGDCYYEGSSEPRVFNLKLVGDKVEYISDEWNVIIPMYEFDYVPPMPKVNFPDVDYNAWYGDAVEYAVSAGLMKGYANGKFGTTDGIQRQDFIVILARLSGANLEAFADRENFKDAQYGAYYYSALAWAKATGVSKGYDNGKFGVGDKVTREQIVTFLYNYAKLKGYYTDADLTENDVKKTYSDYKNVSSFAKDATLWALSTGVISGKETKSGKLIAPQATAQRCEVAKMFYNIESNYIFY